MAQTLGDQKPWEILINGRRAWCPGQLCGLGEGWPKSTVPRGRNLQYYIFTVMVMVWSELTWSLVQTCSKVEAVGSDWVTKVQMSPVGYSIIPSTYYNLIDFGELMVTQGIVPHWWEWVLGGIPSSSILTSVPYSPVFSFCFLVSRIWVALFHHALPHHSAQDRPMWRSYITTNWHFWNWEPTTDLSSFHCLFPVFCHSHGKLINTGWLFHTITAQSQINQKRSVQDTDTPDQKNDVTPLPGPYKDRDT